jgi:DNA repair protein RadC
MQQELFAQPLIYDPPPRLEPIHYVPVYRVQLVHDAAVSIPLPQLRTSQDSATLFRRYLGPVDREHFLVALLDRKNRVIGLNIVAIGSLTAAVVHPREVFNPAILANAAALVLCHNHPSGDVQPSQEDRTLTRRLVEAGKLLGMEVLDHIILGDGTTTYFSFADAGILHKEKD